MQKYFNRKKFKKLVKEIELEHDTIIIFITDDDNKMYYNDHIISIENYDQIITKLQKAEENKKKIKLILHCGGGSIFSSDIIIKGLLKYEYNVESYIIKHAESASTLIALSSNMIYMDKYAHLTPTDPQYDIMINNEVATYSSKILLDYLDIIKNKKINHPDTLSILESLDSKSNHFDNISTINTILDKRHNQIQNREVIINLFCSGEYPHSKPIDYYDLQKLQLHAQLGIPQYIYQLFYLFLGC